MEFQPFRRISKLFRHRKPVTTCCGCECSACSHIFNPPSQLSDTVSQIGYFTGSELPGTMAHLNPGAPTEGSEVALDPYQDITSPPLPSQPIPNLAPNERSHVEIGGHVFFSAGSVDYLLRIDAALLNRYTTLGDKAKPSIGKGEMRIVSPNIHTVLVPGRKVVLAIGNGTANGTGYDEYIAKVELAYDANAAPEGRNSLIGGPGLPMLRDVSPQTRTQTQATIQTTSSGPRSGNVSRPTSTDIGASSLLTYPSQTQQLHSLLGISTSQPSPIREAPENGLANAHTAPAAQALNNQEHRPCTPPKDQDRIHRTAKPNAGDPYQDRKGRGRNSPPPTRIMPEAGPSSGPTVNAARANDRHSRLAAAALYGGTTKATSTPRPLPTQAGNRKVAKDASATDAPANPNISSSSPDIFYQTRTSVKVEHTQEIKTNMSRHPPHPARNSSEKAALAYPLHRQP
ncbi:hypothetical protein BT96DRAFT_552382 [Gymnopus androsaceus JB14]|uniref:Uncharacterized protein n=1 Tax=Gymnopus androsaceus JB14 TaxID=1447944 RepID=A0A6A4HXC3_9AGAR|nr:hypothetical protein BT96DRAFT_552382 [Gymnopus androsaceus JB14]